MRAVALSLWLLVLPAAVAAGSPAPAVRGEEAPPAAPEGLAEIAGSLQRIEVLLRTQVEIQRLELLMRRTQLGNDELLPLQSDLRQARSRIADGEAEISSGELHLRDYSARLEALSPGDEEAKAIDQAIQKLERELRFAKAALQKQRAQAEELETDLRKRVAERDDVKSLLDRALARLEAPRP